MRQPSRIHIAIVVVGGTLGIFVLLLAQVFLPFELGLVGLAAVVALDVVLFLVYRHRGVVRRIPPGYLLGMPERDRQRLASRRAQAKARKTAGAVVEVLFVVGLYVAGWMIRLEAMVNSSGLALYLLGASMVLIGEALVILGFYDTYALTWGGHAIRLESMDYD